MVIEYLFGYERYILCNACPGAWHFTTSVPPPYLNVWAYCRLCNPEVQGQRGWYYRW